MSSILETTVGLRIIWAYMSPEILWFHEANSLVAVTHCAVKVVAADEPGSFHNFQLPLNLQVMYKIYTHDT
jgi:hypothetical protein